jgi:hypothetical protein
MAHRLMWLKEDREAQEKRGGPFWTKVKTWFMQHYRHCGIMASQRPEGPGAAEDDLEALVRADDDGERGLQALLVLLVARGGGHCSACI